MQRLSCTLTIQIGRPTPRRAEDLGFDTVVVADHVGSDWSPWQCLAAAVAATERIHVGTFVLNASLHHPLMVAREVATLDRLSGGRVELGLGAGHTPAEFAAMGTPLLPAAERKVRLATSSRSSAPCSTATPSTITAPTSTSPRASIGDASPRRAGADPRRRSGAGLLTHAGRHADIVGFTGLGRTLRRRPPPHRALPARGARRRGRGRPAAAGETTVELNVLVQVVE